MIVFTFWVMRLEPYLECLKDCEDRKLQTELGVSDNWPIFMKANYSEFLDKLGKSGKYRLEQTIKEKAGIRNILNYLPGIVVLQLIEWVPPFFIVGDKEDKERQRRDYSMAVILHPYQKPKVPIPEKLRALANVIEDLGQLLIKNSIPACMPYSLGSEDPGNEDYSKIVYFDPEGSFG